MSNSIIRASFETKLAAWANAQTPKISIAYQNQSFAKPSNGAAYLEAFLLPNDTLNKELSGQRKTYIGIFQVNCWIKSGIGIGQGDALAQEIINLFPMLPKSGAVSIEQTPTQEKAILDDSGWMIVPVTIKYRMESVL